MPSSLRLHTAHGISPLSSLVKEGMPWIDVKYWARWMFAPAVSGVANLQHNTQKSSKREIACWRGRYEEGIKNKGELRLQSRFQVFIASLEPALGVLGVCREAEHVGAIACLRSSSRRHTRVEQRGVTRTRGASPACEGLSCKHRTTP